jgi:hypothetical protein
MAVRRTDLVGSSIASGYRLISMTLPRVEALPSVRTQTEVASMKDHLDLLGESYLDPVNTPPPAQANVVSDFYDPMRNLRKPMNFDVTSGFVRMSDMFNDVCMLVFFMLPFWISSRKWCHLIYMCFVLGLFYKGSLAKWMSPWLSSHMIDGSSLDLLFEWLWCSNLRVVMLFVDRLFIFSKLGNNPHESMSFSVLCIGSRALQHWLSAMYSASVELSAISVCSLLDQCMGTPARTMMKPVCDKHESRRCANYWCHTPAK